VTAVAQFFSLDQVTGQICCSNIAALNQSSKNRKRVSAGVKHSNLHHAIRMLKCPLTMSFQYRHERAHQDRLKPWPRLSLEEQLNLICDKLANGEVRHYLSYSSPVSRKLQLLPPEKAAVLVGTKKMTTNVGPEVHFQLGREDALRFYTLPMVLVGRVNKGGLGWSQRRFEQVSWSTLELVLCSKPDTYQLWLSKQCIGICATRRNLAHIQDILDDKCPNCGQA
jgi:hypothetical protein